MKISKFRCFFQFGDFQENFTILMFLFHSGIPNFTTHRQSALQGRDGKDAIWPANRQLALDRSLIELIRMNGPANLGDVVPLTQAMSELIHFQAEF